MGDEQIVRVNARYLQGIEALLSSHASRAHLAKEAFLDALKGVSGVDRALCHSFLARLFAEADEPAEVRKAALAARDAFADAAGVSPADKQKFIAAEVETFCQVWLGLHAQFYKKAPWKALLIHELQFCLPAPEGLRRDMPDTERGRTVMEYWRQFPNMKDAGAVALAGYLHEIGRHQDAVAWFEKTLSRGPAVTTFLPPNSFYNLVFRTVAAEAMVACQQYERAYLELLRALREEPEKTKDDLNGPYWYARAQDLLGSVGNRLGEGSSKRLAEALKWAEEQLPLVSSEADAISNRVDQSPDGRGLERVDAEINELFSTVARVKSSAPGTVFRDDVGAYYAEFAEMLLFLLRGAVFMKRQQWKTALESLGESTRIALEIGFTESDGVLARNHLYTGLSHGMLNEEEQSRRCLQQAVVADPKGEIGRFAREMLEGVETSVAASSQPKNACFIATAACGDERAAEVVVLRRFRDQFLLRHQWGRLAVDGYQALSPWLAAFIACHAWLRLLVRQTFIRPLAFALRFFTDTRRSGTIERWRDTWLTRRRRRRVKWPV